MEKRNKAFYAAPGGNDKFMRPGTGHGWSPREIATCNQGKYLWTAWIHRHNNREYLAVTIKTPASKGTLAIVEDKYEYYSKPTFLSYPNSKVLQLISFVRQGAKSKIKIYQFKSNKWTCTQTFGTTCVAVYHMDAIATSQDNAYIVYSGSAEGRKGLAFYSISLATGLFGKEQSHVFANGCINRPKLVIDQKNQVLALTDIYCQKRFGIYSINLSVPKAKWKNIYADSNNNMFPSVARDSQGVLYLSWLHQESVRREDVAGLRQYAMMACKTGAKWRIIKDKASEYCADLNLGLLPIKRYFGYDGLRRYPRVLATNEGSVWLIWEQQKDEDEIWNNLANGYLLGKEYKNGRFSPTRILVDMGSCFAIDNKTTYPSKSVRLIAKGAHTKSGNDFVALDIDLTQGVNYDSLPKSYWNNWKKFNLLDETKKNSHLSITSSQGEKFNLYWGDLHCHSIHSPDAEGEADELYHFARDVSNLDFIALTDNDYYPNKILLNSEIHYIAEVARALSSEDFIAMSGFEWTFHRPNKQRSFNHRIIIYPENEHQTVRRNEPAGISQIAFKKFADKNGYFHFPHHAFWKLIGGKGENAVEITSAWGTYMLDADTVTANLNNGVKFAFLGNSDSHRFLPGVAGALTGVYAENLTQEAIISAIKAGRSFATTGNRTAIDFRVNNSLMGSTIKVQTKPAIKWSIIAHSKVEEVAIIRNGQVVHKSNKANGEWQDKEVKVGRYWYIIQVKEDGEYQRYPHNVASAWGKYAWSSPIWVTSNAYSSTDSSGRLGVFNVAECRNVVIL